MQKHLAIAFLAGALGLAGCATTEPQGKAAPGPQAGTAPSAAKNDEVLTGSRIPRKTLGEQPVSQISSEEIRRNSSPDVNIMQK
jgi:hypothetical protein